MAAVLLLVGAGCQKCVKAHDAVRHVGPTPTYSYIHVGKSVMQVQTGVRPEHDEIYSVCDQYQEDK